MFVTLTVIVALAVGVLVVLLVTRRSVSDWQIHFERTTNEWKNKDKNEATKETPQVEPLSSDLETVMRTEGKAGSAYLRADELPSFEQRSGSSEE